MEVQQSVAVKDPSAVGVIAFQRGMNPQDLYAHLIDPTKYGQRVVVRANTAGKMQQFDVTAYADFMRLEDQYRRGKFMGRTFVRENGWGENVIARLYRGAECMQQYTALDQIPGNVSRNQEVWRLDSKGEPRLMMYHDASIVGEFQSSAEPLSAEQLAAVGGGQEE